MTARWFIWPLIFSFCLQALGQTLILGRFYLHRAEIERTRCENRLKPELQCHGKCQLKKDLASAATDQEPSRTTPEIRQWILDLPVQYPTLTAMPVEWSQGNFRLADPVTSSHLPDVFHPPAHRSLIG
ncbi:MAG: hypothetical protein R2787_03310 [Saprospiraceae bacterium]